jgi:hypothetical protein
MISTLSACFGGTAIITGGNHGFPHSQQLSTIIQYKNYTINITETYNFVKKKKKMFQSSVPLK